MKIILSLMSILILISACSENIAVYNSEDVRQMTENQAVTIVFEKDLTGIDCEGLERYRLENLIDGLYCFELEAIEQINEEAISLGANFVNIVELSIISRLDYSGFVEFYNVNFQQFTYAALAKENREFIYYKEKPDLLWEDFINIIPEQDSVDYLIKFDLYADADVSLLWGNIKDFHVDSAFFSDLSGVKESIKTDSRLLFFQLIYNLSQIYAGRLEKFLENDLAKPRTNDRIQDSLIKYYKLFEKEKKLLIKDTDHGRNENKLKSWKVIIDNYRLETQ
ncbi:MAG: hypothetical protein KAS53_10655 [Candidatus Cloacimonetes bacterium]|nr:hypothetical protein [Candidatus Cloacimonadota bacterium]